MTRVVTPITDPIATEIEYGRYTKFSVRSKVRGRASGIHINMARVASGVGLKASLPSWTIRGLGYWSLGKGDHFLFSSGVTKYTSCK